MPALAFALLPALLLTTAATAETSPAADAAVIQEWKVDYGGRPRDPYVAPDGKVWFVGQAGNYVAHFDPKTETFRRYEIEDGTLNVGDYIQNLASIKSEADAFRQRQQAAAARTPQALALAPGAVRDDRVLCRED